jgi:exopolysaccharide biosynthesis WecB/TagA/CpsF family protein
MKKKIENAVLLGIPVAILDTAETIEAIVAMAADRAVERCRILVTVNVDFVVNALRTFRCVPRNPELLAIMRRSPLVSPDGMPIVTLSRLLGVPLKERVPGADLVPLLAAKAAETGLKLYFLGGTPESTRRAAEILRERHPALRIVGIDTPFVSLADTPENTAKNREICEKINACAPDILFVGFGNPKQELWMDRHAAELKVPVAIGVGGTFNFLSGNVKRAPVWMQKSGLEWIYRIMQEPRRLIKRYSIGLVKFGTMSVLCLAASLLGRTTNTARQTEWLNREPRETDEALELDCRGLARLDNPARLNILDAHLTAERRRLPLRFVNLSPGAKLQLLAHKLYR